MRNLAYNLLRLALLAVIIKQRQSYTHSHTLTHTHTVTIEQKFFTHLSQNVTLDSLFLYL